MNYIIIDAGTTNTRIRLVEDYKIIDTLKYDVGVRDTAITGSLYKLKYSIKTGIEECLKRNYRKLKDIDSIIASGMITSELGLVEIPHLIATVGVEDLARGVVIKEFPDIVGKPIHFIPGVKNEVGGDFDFSQMDMMRGEEVEAIGLSSLYGQHENVIFISPGSHTKFIFINKGKIVRCSTTLTGELLYAISKETVLANSIPEELIVSINKEYIKKGMDAAEKNGFSRTCFLVRIMDIFTESNGNELANFMAGAIGYYDIKLIQENLNKDNIKVLIGGKQILRELYSMLLELKGHNTGDFEAIDDNIVEKSSVIGAISIIEKYKEVSK